MIMTKKLLHTFTHDNTLALKEAVEGQELVTDSNTSLSDKKSSIPGRLSSVTNVPDTMGDRTNAQNGFHSNRLSPQHLGDMHSAGTPLMNTLSKRLCSNDLGRISEIIDQLLPKADAEYQLALTTMENVDIRDQKIFDNSKKAYFSAYKHKRELQDEAILRLMHNRQMNSGKGTIDTLQFISTDEDFLPLISLIFRLSCSYDDLGLLLDKVAVREQFESFAQRLENVEIVNQLFQILNINLANSLKNEIISKAEQ